MRKIDTKIARVNGPVDLRKIIVNNSTMVVLINTNVPCSNNHEQLCCFIITQQYCWQWRRHGPQTFAVPPPPPAPMCLPQMRSVL